MSSMTADEAHALDDAPCPTSVYRYYDRHGVLIYIGITRQGIGRNRQHNDRAEWWPFVARQEVDHYPTRVLAASREKELIREFRPPFNKQHNLDHVEARAAYLAFALAPSTSPMTARRIYEGLPAGAERNRRWMAVDVVSQTPSLVVFRTRLQHAPLASTLVLRGETTGVVDSSGRIVAALDTLGHHSGFAVFTCIPTALMPSEIVNARASLHWPAKGRKGAPYVRHILLNAEGPVVG